MGRECQTNWCGYNTARNADGRGRWAREEQRLARIGPVRQRPSARSVGCRGRSVGLSDRSPHGWSDGANFVHQLRKLVRIKRLYAVGKGAFRIRMDLDNQSV